MAFDTLSYAVENGVATITLNRPAQLNAITQKMYEELPIAFRRAAEDPAVVVTVLTGTGRFFSSGADVTERPTVAPPSLEDRDATRAYYRRRFDGTIEKGATAIIEHPKVVIAALNGPVVGVAAALISHADLIYISSNTTLHAPFTSLAISPEAGSSFMFMKRMGYSKAMEALLFSKKFSAEELIQCGFANAVLPTENFHSQLAQKLAPILKSTAPASLITTKKLIHANFKDQQQAAVYREVKELTERFVSGDPQRVFGALMAKHAKGKL
ncbi:hypothetical protein HDU85_003848 [Gaertneriomyces sp. JEL0708]|nr:hypothetical protein HDU85_003848 [Gaertneriomyces sp. JEL0708]